MPSQHKHPPIQFRPHARNRTWLLEEAEETKRPVNAILNEAVTELRKSERNRRRTMPKQEPEPIRAKWTMDDAKTLAEAAAMLRARADELDKLAAEGWTLEGPIEDDWGFLVPPEGTR